MAVSTERVVSSALLPRPATLIIPNDTLSLPILDTSSYSPFPTFPGSKHARDPYGLNAYLLHPAEEAYAAAPSSDAAQPRGRTPSKDAPTLGKRRSTSMLRRPSPLSQPPVGPDVPADMSFTPTGRKRSSSVDSASSASIKFKDDFLATLPKQASKTPKSITSKTLRYAFKLGKKTMVDVPVTPVVPIDTSSSETLASAASGIDMVAPLLALVPDQSPTTPMSSRSMSSHSAVSSASSASSDGVQTPSDSVTLDISVAGVKLADALLEVESKHTRRKSWMGWLGARRGSKTSINSADSSGTNTPIPSNDPSPNASSVDLTSLSPSPAIESPSRSYLSVKARPAAESPSPLWVTDRLRRMSYSKMNQVRVSSPHPFARALRRQHFNLPDEVALSLQAGKRVFPASVNPHQPETVLYPTTGMWQGLVIRNILDCLDRGTRPTGVLTSRYPIAPSSFLKSGTTKLQPKGMSDFIHRPPYEDRMMVFYPDDKFSPISMARPGYGVWELDFSDYVLGLAEMDDPQTRSRSSLSNSLAGFVASSSESESGSPEWLNVPRGSIGNFDDLEAVIGMISGLNGDAPTAIDDAPLSDSAAVEELEVPIEAVIDSTVAVVAPAVATEVVVTEVKSSFRHDRKQTWDDSDSESDDDSDDEESDVGDEPLAMIMKKRSSQALHIPIRPSSTSHHGSSMPSDTARPSSSYIQSNSLGPVSRRASSYDLIARDRSPAETEAAKARALASVAEARQRQQQARSGEVERLAVAEQMRNTQQSTSDQRRKGSSCSPPRTFANARPTSMMKGKFASTNDLPTASPLRSTAFRAPSVVISPATPGEVGLSRTNAGADFGADGDRRAASTGRMAGKRYHSFYDVGPGTQRASSPSSTPGPTPGQGSGRQSMYKSFNYASQGQQPMPFPHQPVQGYPFPHMHMGMPMGMPMQMPVQHMPPPPMGYQGYPPVMGYGGPMQMQMSMMPMQGQGQGQGRWSGMGGQQQAPNANRTSRMM